MTAATTNDRPGVDVFTIAPPGLGTTLRISIAAPVRPAIGGDADGETVIVYATDGDFFFGTVADAARVGGFGGDLAPATIVGIGYADETGDLAFASRRRLLDFYRGPRRPFDGGSYGPMEFGGAEAFLAALRDHVIPMVERRIAGSAPPRRILLGTSAGGHFATYALAQQPDLFAGLALMSPMLVDPQTDAAPGADTMVQLVEALPADALPAGLRVFLSAGGREEDPGTMFADYAINGNALRMRAALARRGVATDFVLFADEAHGSATAAAIGRALRFLLPARTAKPDWQAALAAKSD